MRWMELESDIKLGTLTEAFRRLDCLSVIHAVANLAQGIRVYALRSSVEAIMSHARSDVKEIGGLLLGHVYQSDIHARTPAGALTIVTEAVASAEYRNSSVSLEMGTEIWCRINERVFAENLVVGWYHSHPNLGAYFSGTDRRTQKAFFGHHYSLGWVIDPFRNEQKLFCGGESQEYQPPIVVLDHDFAMAKNH